MRANQSIEPDPLVAPTSGQPGQEPAVRLPGPAEKLAIAHGLRCTAWELSAAGVRLRHPTREEEWVQEQVREIFLRATTT